MIVIAITGSISTGKSTVVSWLEEMGLAVYDADASVRKLFEENKAVMEFLKNIWPESVGPDGVDRKYLRQRVLNDPSAIKQLEAITHPIVNRMHLDFLEKRRAAGDEIVFLDIPLLFETQTSYLTDGILVVYCSQEKQRERALARGFDPELFDYLFKQQIPIAEKLEKADFKLDNNGTLAETREKLIEVLHEIESKYGLKILKD